MGCGYMKTLVFWNDSLKIQRGIFFLLRDFAEVSDSLKLSRSASTEVGCRFTLRKQRLYPIVD